MFSIAYKPIIRQYLSNPVRIAINGRTIIMPNILQSLCNDEVFAYYNLDSFFLREIIIDEFLEELELSDLVNVIKNLYPFLKENNMFIDSCVFAIKESISLYSDIEANELVDGYDVQDIIDSYSEYNEYGLSYNNEGAASELKQLMEEDMYDEVIDYLNSLPESIHKSIDIDKDIFVYVNGTDSIVDSYIDEPNYDYYDYLDASDSTNDSTNFSEIDDIFDR